MPQKQALASPKILKVEPVKIETLITAVAMGQTKPLEIENAQVQTKPPIQEQALTKTQASVQIQAPTQTQTSPKKKTILIRRLAPIKKKASNSSPTQNPTIKESGGPGRPHPNTSTKETGNDHKIGQVSLGRGMSRHALENRSVTDKIVVLPHERKSVIIFRTGQTELKVTVLHSCKTVYCFSHIETQIWGSYLYPDNKEQFLNLIPKD